MRKSPYFPARKSEMNQQNLGVAAVLSFVIPGLGQLYRGQIAAGFLWLAIVFAGYFACLIPGILLHVACVAAAAMR